MKIITFLCLLIVNVNLYSQTRYVNLGDFTGLLTEADKIELEAKSCVLKDSFPPSIQPNFGVFDWGFYPLNEYMEQNFDALLGDVKSKALATKPYYLLICRGSAPYYSDKITVS